MLRAGRRSHTKSARLPGTPPLSRFSLTLGPFDVVSSYDHAVFEVCVIEYGVRGKTQQDRALCCRESQHEADARFKKSVFFAFVAAGDE